MKIANILAVAGLCATGLAQTGKVKISKDPLQWDAGCGNTR
jgi:hypothetical protein